MIKPNSLFFLLLVTSTACKDKAEEKPHPRAPVRSATSVSSQPEKPELEDGGDDFAQEEKRKESNNITHDLEGGSPTQPLDDTESRRQGDSDGSEHALKEVEELRENHQALIRSARDFIQDLSKADMKLVGIKRELEDGLEKLEEIEESHQDSQKLLDATENTVDETHLFVVEVNGILLLQKINLIRKKIGDLRKLSKSSPLKASEKLGGKTLEDVPPEVVAERVKQRAREFQVLKEEIEKEFDSAREFVLAHELENLLYVKPEMVYVEPGITMGGWKDVAGERLLSLSRSSPSVSLLYKTKFELEEISRDIFGRYGQFFFLTNPEHGNFMTSTRETWKETVEQLMKLLEIRIPAKEIQSFADIVENN